MNAFISVLKEWQTFAGGLLTLAGGGFIWHQTRTNIRLSVNQRKAQFDAALATLPLTIDGIVDWADSTARKICDIHAACNSASSVPRDARRVSWDTLPNQHIEELRKSIEFSDSSEFRSYCSNLFSKLQVCRARLKSIDPAGRKNRVMIRTDLEVYLFDIIEIRMLAEHMLGFARREEVTFNPKPDWDRLTTQMLILGLDDSEFPWLAAQITAAIEKQSDG